MDPPWHRGQCRPRVASPTDTSDQPSSRMMIGLAATAASRSGVFDVSHFDRQPAPHTGSLCSSDSRSYCPGERQRRLVVNRRAPSPAASGPYQGLPRFVVRPPHPQFPPPPPMLWRPQRPQRPLHQGRGSPLSLWRPSYPQRGPRPRPPLTPRTLLPPRPVLISYMRAVREEDEPRHEERGRTPTPRVPCWRREQQHVDINDLPPFGVRTAVAATLPPHSVASSPTDSGSFSPPDTSADIDDLIALTEEMRIHDLMDEPDSSVGSNSSLSSQQAHILQKVQEGQSLMPQGNPQSNVLRRTINKNHQICAFCRGNGETPSLFTSHVLHEWLPDGSRKVACPILRNLRCEECGATGDSAHTRSHCPINKQPSVAALLKKTARRCDGKLRRAYYGCYQLQQQQEEQHQPYGSPYFP